jgi:ABC-2 type transport system permease protein
VSTARATALVAGRELREAFRRKSLWIVFGILFLGSSVAMALPEILDSGPTRYDVATIDGADATTADRFQVALRPVVRSGDDRIRFRTVADLAAARALVDDGKVDVAVAFTDPATVVVRADEHETLVAFVRQALGVATLRDNLRSAGLSPGQVDDALRVPTPRIEEMARDDSDRSAAAAVLSIVLYLVLLLLMVQAANGVAIEKANRISEVLLAIVRPGPLLFGKVIGVGLVGLAGLAAAAIPVLVKGVTGGDLPAGLGPAIAGGIVWIVLGLVLYLTIAGSLGALVERQEEAGSVLTPLTLLLVATYIVAQSSASSGFGAFLAIFPLTSPIVMPSRIALGEATVPEIVLSLVVGIATVVLAIRLGAAIFRRGIVHTGKRLRLGEALRNP